MKITNEMVENACRAAYPGWDEIIKEAERVWKRKQMHSALSAALQSAADTPAPQALHDPDSDPIQVLSVENERLRHVISDCAAALMTGAFISPKASVEFMEGLPKEISLVTSELRGTQSWNTMRSAPKTGEEFIARVGPEWASFSCFWDGEAFVHFDKDDGFIRYSPTEWMQMPAPLPPSKVREE